MMAYRLSHKGFTLIEVLVVMIIIAILAGAAVMSIRNNNYDRMLEEANRFNNLVLLAKDEALFQSRAIGIGFAEKGYAFFLEKEDDPDIWVTFDEKPFIPHAYFSGLLTDVVVDKNSLVLPEIIKQPDIMLSPDGEVTPFEIHYSYLDENTIVLKYDNLGQRILDKSE